MTIEQIRVEEAAIRAEMLADMTLLDKHPAGDICARLIEACAKRSERRAELLIARMDDIMSDIKRIVEA